MPRLGPFEALRFESVWHRDLTRPATEVIGINLKHRDSQPAARDEAVEPCQSHIIDHRESVHCAFIWLFPHNDPLKSVSSPDTCSSTVGSIETAFADYSRPLPVQGEFSANSRYLVRGPPRASAKGWEAWTARDSPHLSRTRTGAAKRYCRRRSSM